jgi:hypothetical protein
MSHTCLYGIIKAVSSGFPIPAIGSSEGRGLDRQQVVLHFIQYTESRLKTPKLMKFNFILACSGYRIFITLEDLTYGIDEVVPALNQLSTMP